MDRVASQPSADTGPFRHLLARLARHRAGRRAYARTLEQLNRLSDSALCDIGLTRASIRDAAEMSAAAAMGRAFQGH